MKESIYENVQEKIGNVKLELLGIERVSYC